MPNILKILLNILKGGSRKKILQGPYQGLNFILKCYFFPTKERQGGEFFFPPRLLPPVPTLSRHAVASTLQKASVKKARAISVVLCFISDLCDIQG